MKEHILVISQYFYPENFRINDICKEWVKKGHIVTVITGIPNYPQGKFFKGYGWFKKRKDNYEGVNVIRIPIVSRGNSGIRLMLNYVSYVVSGFWWKLFTKIKADKVFIFQTSPMTQALVGVWYAKKRKIPCYMYVQDLWPDSVVAITGINNKVVVRLLDKMANYIYKNCKCILGTSPSFVKMIEKRESAWTDDGKSKVRYWPQYAEAFYKPVEKTEMLDLLVEDTFKIVFTGNIGYAQGLDILPQVAELLYKKGVVCEFIIIGNGRYMPELQRNIEQKKVGSMFKLLGRKSPEEIPYYLAHCDLAFLSFAENELFNMTIPAKLQSYMACGKAILVVAGGETKRVVEEAECGVVCGYGDVEQVAEVIQSFIANPQMTQEMQRKALIYSELNFNGQKLLNQLEIIMDIKSNNE